MNAVIIPAIIGKDFAEVKEKLEKVKSLVDWVQIDVVDGVFAEPETWGARIGHNLHLWEPLQVPKVEMHLMVGKPAVVLDDWISAHVDRILMHIESGGDKKRMIEKVKKAGTQAGLVLKLETDISAVEPYIKDVDVVQLMSIATIGSYGAPFDERVLGKIKGLREKYPSVTIEIDGGVNLENAPKLISAGANNLVIGSAIFESGDMEGTIKRFGEL